MTELYKYQEYYIPLRMMEGIDRYVKHGIPPGDFLRAIFENDLMGALGRADDENTRNIPAYGAYLYNEVPQPCHGSPEQVAAWIAKFNYQGDFE